MLSWWGWLVLWLVLVLVSAALLAWSWRRTWRSAKALTRELGEAERLLAALEVQRDRPDPQDDSQPTRLAAFDNPLDLAATYLVGREERKEAKRRRRADRLPGWARSVE